MKLKQVSWLPAAIIMGVIFFFSSKPAEVSDQNSLSIAEGILTTYENIVKTSYEKDIRIVKLAELNHFVRKGAHCTEYAILSIAVAFHFFVKGKRGMYLFLLSVAITAMYAATDEFHQLFVPGRSGEIRDVVIDTIGAVIGGLVFLYLATAYEKPTKKQTTAL